VTRRIKLYMSDGSAVVMHCMDGNTPEIIIDWLVEAKKQGSFYCFTGDGDKKHSINPDHVMRTEEV